ncbi:MAG TPA: hypothetical protein VHD62_18905 [Opitutaceae bacterium]|nr:hypothetical protein [Opitutaceae bacterium]
MTRPAIQPARPSLPPPPSRARSPLSLPVALAAAALTAIAVWEGTTLSRQNSEIAATHAQAAQRDAELAQLKRQRDTAADRLRATEQEIARLAAIPDVEIDAEVAAWLARVARLREFAARHAEQTIPEFSLLTEKDWFDAARVGQSITDGLSTVDDHEALLAAMDAANTVLQAEMQSLRDTARMRVAPNLRAALIGFADAHDGQLPSNVRELAPFATPPIDPAILARYEMAQHGNILDVARDAWLLDEKTSFDEAHDNRLYLARGSFGTTAFSEPRQPDLRAALQGFLTANNGQFPSTPAQLVPFFPQPPSPVALKAFLEKPATDFTSDELRKLLPAD